MVHPRTVKRVVNACRNCEWGEVHANGELVTLGDVILNFRQLQNLSRYFYGCIEKRTDSCRRLIILTNHFVHSGANVPHFLSNTPHCIALLSIPP